MPTDQIGIIHPGEMGSFVAGAASRSGYKVLWASEGRSSRTRSRAEELKLADAGSIAGLCEQCDVILSVCPPHAAEDVADQVLAAGFKGLYLDANAVSPQKVKHMAEKSAAAGAEFVDGGIIGLPDWSGGRTWLYLSGGKAQELEKYFTSELLIVKVIGAKPGKASALKMCYAANTKGTTALVCAVSAAAESLGVREELQRQWSMEGRDLAKRAPRMIRNVTAKAWRFAGEMEEISNTFEQAGLHGGFHAAAAEIYRRISGFKNAPSAPSLEDVLASLIKK